MRGWTLEPQSLQHSGHLDLDKLHRQSYTNQGPSMELHEPLADTSSSLHNRQYQKEELVIVFFGEK